MTALTLQDNIKQAVSRLLEMAREMTHNEISNNYKFILTGIKSSRHNAHVERKLNKIENDKKSPVRLEEMMPTLQSLYENLYDINLHIYRATKELTVIDIRYYPKSSLDEDYRQKVQNNPPMLHCKIAIPFWLSDKKGKFDINWEHHERTNDLRLFWARFKMNIQSRFR